MMVTTDIVVAKNHDYVSPTVRFRLETHPFRYTLLR